ALKAWLAFRMLDQAAAYLPHGFANAHFAFHGKLLDGRSVDEPRWKRGVETVDTYLGNALGREYVRRWFPPDVKSAAEAVAANIKEAMRRRLQNLAWMTP